MNKSSILFPKTIHMKKLTQIFTTLLFLTLTAVTVQAQIGFGLTSGGDLYQRYTNPKDATDSTGALRSSGNVFTNMSVGPKIWIGSRRFSVSFETQVNIGLTAFSIREYKGLGAVSFPIMAHLNFKGLSGFNKNSFGTGYAIGGGIQYNRTELYGVTSKFDGIQRKLFPTYVAEVKVGGGGQGILFDMYIRYGLGLDENYELNGANSFNIGFNAAYNLTLLRKRGKKKPKSDKPSNRQNTKLLN